MGKLRDLLKTEAERQQALQEWMDLLDGLFARIDSWLKASDPEGLLDVKQENVAINDPALGEYKAPARRIELGNRLVEIAPKARYVAATIRPPGADQAVRARAR